jgi:hypothetical protein
MFEYNEDGDADDAGDADAGTCVDHQCVTMYEAAECRASSLGCSWDPDSYSCWPKAFAKPCTSFYDEKPCTGGGCSWNADTYECSEQGSPALCHNQYSDTECAALSQCEWKDYECWDKDSEFPSTPPPLDGPGDGTGSEDMTKCTSSLYSSVKAKLEIADTECVIHGRNRARRGTPKDQQLECLAYFLNQTPNPTTIKEACPCLWAWATEIKPFEDHWMKIKC